ncbi:enoyl-CoA hydratase/isomerase family protein [uncultured Corynebacterium sp.]|uniref:enoyl-CoA hydratase/isomerase family protein n=1 Tax=uncultured Corynebacterium sp. TaxID=159447 RepID=UPI0025F95417|nr:enoyl-CoA hydratase/isomerase family protein [uncultured Corynebacterium sp.]
MAFTTLTVEDADTHLLVRLNRPEVRNAIDQAMVDDLHAVCDRLEREPRTLVITGCEVEGRNGTRGIFASGADITQLRERRRDDALRGINSRIFDRIAALPMPVIAAVDGFALGGGAELALAADFRLGTAAVRFGQPETNLGIIAAAGGLWRLKEITGEQIAKEILLAGRILTGTECVGHGVLLSLHEPDQLLNAAADLAGRIATQDPLAVRVAKRVFAMPRDAHPHVDELAQAILFESQAKFDRMQAFIDRKKK